MTLTRRQRKRLGRWIALGAPAALVAVALLATDWGRLQAAFFEPDIAAELFPEIITVAARNTLVITAFSFVGGLLLVLPAALLRLSPVRAYRWVGTAYVEFFRGIPALVTLIFVGFALPIAMGTRVPGGDNGPKVLGLSLVAGAYIAEVIRAGIQGVPKGQVEAARSLGMGPVQTMVSIVLPQALRIVTPPLTNELVLLLKDSSLVYVLGTTSGGEELTKFGRDALAKNFDGTPITMIALTYLVISVLLTRVSAWLEHRGAVSRP